jgi:hypothetical protein
MLILCRGCCRVSPLLLSMNGRAPMPRQRTGARAPTRGASEQKGRSVVVGARSCHMYMHMYMCVVMI